jgi:cytidylate kinase
MPASVICLSHTDGSGGREVAHLVAERLGFRYVDDGIIATAAEKEGLFPESVALAESSTAGRRLEVDFNRFERTDAVRRLIRDAIVATAAEGDVVIVAHAASYALGDRDDVLRVLVTASDETRQRRLSESEGLDSKESARLLKGSDKGRAEYLKRFYGIGRELPTDYDLVLNTDKLAVGEAVETIVRAAA